MKTQLSLSPASSRKNYYVSLYRDEVKYENRKLFYPFYGKEYPSEKEAKKAAIRQFLSCNGTVDFYNLVTLTEHNGMQLADKNEPYQSKSAIVKILAQKTVIM